MSCSHAHTAGPYMNHAITSARWPFEHDSQWEYDIGDARMLFDNLIAPTNTKYDYENKMIIARELNKFATDKSYFENTFHDIQYIVPNKDTMSTEPAWGNQLLQQGNVREWFRRRAHDRHSSPYITNPPKHRTLFALRSLMNHILHIEKVQRDKENRAKRDAETKKRRAEEEKMLQLLVQRNKEEREREIEQERRERAERAQRKRDREQALARERADKERAIARERADKEAARVAEIAAKDAAEKHQKIEEGKRQDEQAIVRGKELYAQIENGNADTASIAETLQVYNSLYKYGKVASAFTPTNVQFIVPYGQDYPVYNKTDYMGTHPHQWKFLDKEHARFPGQNTLRRWLKQQYNADAENTYKALGSLDAAHAKVVNLYLQARDVDTRYAGTIIEWQNPEHRSYDTKQRLADAMNQYKEYDNATPAPIKRLIKRSMYFIPLEVKNIPFHLIDKETYAPLSQLLQDLQLLQELNPML